MTPTVIALLVLAGILLVGIGWMGSALMRQKQERQRQTLGGPFKVVSERGTQVDVLYEGTDSQKAKAAYFGARPDVRVTLYDRGRFRGRREPTTS